MNLILSILLIMMIYLFANALHNEVQSEQKFQKILKDFKESKTIDEFYQKIKKFL